MRTFARCSLLCAVVALATGPVLQAAPIVTPTLTLTAPAHGSAPASPASSGAKWLALAVIGGIMVRDTGSIAKKFVQRAQGAQGDYKDGVSGAGARMEAAAKSSEGNYEQGVTAAIGRKAYGKGLSGAGAKYEKNATTLGPQRYAAGVQNAADAYAQGVNPYLDRLKSLDLPPKGPRRSPANQQRSVAVQLALGALKEGK